MSDIGAISQSYTGDKFFNVPNKDKSGSAFPRSEIGERGMTLRDYFAAAVLRNSNTCGSPKQIAHWAYEVADIMLAERAK